MVFTVIGQNLKRFVDVCENQEDDNDSEVIVLYPAEATHLIVYAC